jgi:hypothetical protein
MLNLSYVKPVTLGDFMLHHRSSGNSAGATAVLLITTSTQPPSSVKVNVNLRIRSEIGQLAVRRVSTEF